MITYACVRVGTKYGVEYVERLRNMIQRHNEHEWEMICLTDQPEKVEGVRMIAIDGNAHPTWWAKMLLFSPKLRGDNKCIYLDLDTVIIDTLRPLVEFDTPFGICANFTQRAGFLGWPCSYGSCVMSFAPGFGEDIARKYHDHRRSIISQVGRFGDQKAIENLYPNATLLQDVLPVGYFVGRREFSNVRPDGASLLIFAGKERPHNTTHEWIKEEWR
jgi:hypothetical protein